MNPQPRTIITLHDAIPADRRIWVTEPPHEVREKIRVAAAVGDPLVTFCRVTYGEIVEFSIQPTNAMNVEAIA